MELIDIVTPELLETSVVMWPLTAGVNHVATIETDQVLPVSTSCRYGTFSASFPSLYSWYQNNMIVTANQLDAVMLY